MLPLIYALVQAQGFGLPSKATSADSAYVNRMLDSAVASSVAGAGDPDMRRLLVDQVHVWRGADAAWNVARKLDESASGSDHYVTTLALAKVMRDGKREQTRSYLLTLPKADREAIIAALPSFMGQIPPLFVPMLDSLTTDTRTRAKHIYQRGVRLKDRGNPIAGRDTIRYAIEVARSIGLEHYPLEWAMELIALGEPISIRTLVTLAAIGKPHPAGRAYAISQVMERSRTTNAAAASAIADTLLDELRDDTTFAVQFVTARLLDIRRAPGDSVAAEKLRTETNKKHPPRPAGPRVDYALRDSVSLAVRRRDMPGFERALERWSGKDRSGVVITIAAGAVQSGPGWYGPEAALPPSEREWATSMFSRLWSASRELPPASRDTARIALITLLARLNPAAALDSARKGFASQEQRDRARVETLRYLVRVDAPLVAREVGSLKDSNGRSAVYRLLTQASLSGGRLNEARRFADAATHGSIDWVSSQFEVAQMLAKIGQHTDVITLLRRMLPHLHAEPACSGCIVIVGGPSERPGNHRREIIGILSLALEQGLDADVSAWAASQQSPSSRLWAWLEIAQAMSYVKLGQLPEIPMHGR